MKLIYVAGKMDAGTAWQREENIRKAETIALMLIKAGYAVHCPHTQCRHFHGEMPWQEWIDRDLEVIRRCDAVYFIDNWMDSKGATAERNFALENNIPCLYNWRDLMDWAKVNP